MKIFASKIGATHFYDDKGKHQVVTVLKLLKTVIGRVKTEEKDGYKSYVLVLEDEKAKPKKTLKGQFESLNPRRIVEERVEGEAVNKVNDEFSIKDLAQGDIISVISHTKGKGFQGTVKRHGFNTGPKTHGSRNYRRPGSIGMTTPSRVTKGKPMAGHMGNDQVTQKKVKIERIDQEHNFIWVRGHIAGANKRELVIVK